MVKPIDSPLPGMAKPEPVSRDELIVALAAIVGQAKLPPGRRSSGHVKIPAQLIRSAHVLIERERKSRQ